MVNNFMEEKNELEKQLDETKKNNEKLEDELE